MVIWIGEHVLIDSNCTSMCAGKTSGKPNEGQLDFVLSIKQVYCKKAKRIRMNQGDETLGIVLDPW